MYSLLTVNYKRHIGLLTEQLSDFVKISEDVLNAADGLTPYGVKIRYPQELNIEESHVLKALIDMKLVYDFVSTELTKLQELKKSKSVDK